MKHLDGLVNKKLTEQFKVNGLCLCYYSNRFLIEGGCVLL